jgi:hypothetical protein
LREVERLGGVLRGQPRSTIGTERLVEPGRRDGEGVKRLFESFVVVMLISLESGVVLLLEALRRVGNRALRRGAGRKEEGYQHKKRAGRQATSRRGIVPYPWRSAK